MMMLKTPLQSSVRLWDIHFLKKEHNALLQKKYNLSFFGYFQISCIRLSGYHIISTGLRMYSREQVQFDPLRKQQSIEDSVPGSNM